MNTVNDLIQSLNDHPQVEELAKKQNLELAGNVSGDAEMDSPGTTDSFDSVKPRSHTIKGTCVLLTGKVSGATSPSKRGYPTQVQILIK